MPKFTMVHCAALDASMTSLAYSEVINRNGIGRMDIGVCVFEALSKLGELDGELETVIVRLSYST